MRLSIVIPAYNEEGYLGKCLESIERQLDDKDYDVEVIVVNNASTDNTNDIASSFSDVIVVDEPRKGLVQARHAGLAASSGELVANVDADTILPKGWLKKVMSEFDKNEELVALSGPYIYYDLPLYERILVRLFYLAAYSLCLFSILPPII